MLRSEGSESSGTVVCTIAVTQVRPTAMQRSRENSSTLPVGRRERRLWVLILPCLLHACQSFVTDLAAKPSSGKADAPALEVVQNS